MKPKDPHMPQNDNRTTKSAKMRWGISQRILGSVFLVLVLYMLGTFGVTLFSYQRLGSTVNKRLDDAFNEIFVKVGVIFDGFEIMAMENIRKTSGLFSLEKVWGTFQDKHEEYIRKVESRVADSDKNFQDNVIDLQTTYDAGMEKIDEAVSALPDQDARQRLLPVLDQTRKDVNASSEAFREKGQISLNALREGIEADHKQVDEEIKASTGAQVKDAIRHMGDSKVVFAGSQEMTRRQVEDIKFRAADSVRRSIRDSNRSSIISLVVSMAGVTFVVIIISLFMTRSVTRPIREMINILRGMAQGKMPKTMINVKSSDEVGVLVGAFNEMTANLQRVTASRDELNREISERKRAEEERNKFEEQVRHAQKMESVGTMANGLAHNLNNILASIRGLIEMTLMDLPKEGFGHDNLAKTVESIEEAKGLIDKMLAFSRKRSDDVKPVRLQPIIVQAIELFKVAIALPVNVDCKIDENCGPVLANESDIRQIVINLLNNAHQAFRDNEGCIQVVLKEVEVDEALASKYIRLIPKTYVRLTVCDDGVGVSEEVMDHIFEPFFTTKAVGKGTGLGLSVILGTILGLNGEITVESRAGQGTTFHVYLPLAGS